MTFAAESSYLTRGAPHALFASATVGIIRFSWSPHFTKGTLQVKGVRVKTNFRY